MKLCGFITRRYKGGLLVCGAPAKMAGGKPRCCDHWPGVIR